MVSCYPLSLYVYTSRIASQTKAVLIPKKYPIIDLSNSCVSGTTENDDSEKKALLAYTVLVVVQISYLVQTHDHCKTRYRTYSNLLECLRFLPLSTALPFLPLGQDTSRPLLWLLVDNHC